MPPILLPQSELKLHTRCENQVKNEINREAVRYGDTLAVEAFRKKYPNCTHRPIQPSRKYNCHGMTFAARRTWIDESDQVKMIIADDEYRNIAAKDVLPGDIVVYLYAGDPEHSGIVVKVDEFAPFILSKWGPYHEVIHRPLECPYDSMELKYYRIET